MTDTNPVLSIITLYSPLNTLNPSMKTMRVSDWIQKLDYVLTTGDSFQIEIYQQIESKRMEKTYVSEKQ